MNTDEYAQDEPEVESSLDHAVSAAEGTILSVSGDSAAPSTPSSAVRRITVLHDSENLPAKVSSRMCRRWCAPQRNSTAVAA